jgi:uncharacterized protein
VRKLGVLAVLVLTFTAGAGVVRAQDIPTIYLYVNDLTNPGALLSNEISSIENLCVQVDQITSAEIAILLVNTTDPWALDAFALKTFEANGIGKKGRDNGVLLVISTDARAWRFEVGYGLEGALPDSFVGRVGLDNLTPALQAGDFYTGIYDATWAVGNRIVEKYDAGAANPQPNLIVFDWRAFAIIVAVFIGVAIVTRGRSLLWVGALFRLFRRGGFGGGRSGGGGASGR